MILQQFPWPPPEPIVAHGPLERVFDFCIAYLLLVSIVLLVLPRQWARRVIQIALHLGEPEA